MSENKINFDPNKPMQVGGQAVIEGVMMRAPGMVATAVRRANGEIVIKKEEFHTLAERKKFFKTPILRGAVGLVEIMILGVRTLNFSADIAMMDIEEAEAKNGKKKNKKAGSNSSWKLALTVLVAFAIGMAIFFVTPLFIATHLFQVEQDAFAFNLISGSVRLLLLIIYITAISFMKDVQRVFQYHGAEHKVVFAFESKAPLTIEGARIFSRFHPRCGTSFLLIVMLASIFIFSIFDSLYIQYIGPMNIFTRLLTHLPLVPFVGGAAYEFIRLSARKSNTTIGKILVAPCLWLQNITTKEPTDDQIEVALKALQVSLRIGASEIIPADNI
ncbi:MAG: DUF1385 domain-containing protein [Bacteroidota bacterium]|nr:DUF1385 domain-containing protein [Bacteroidota bacterium]